MSDFPKDFIRPVSRFGQLAIASDFPVSSDVDTNFKTGVPNSFDAGSDTNKAVLLPDINRIADIACREQYFRQCGGIHTFVRELSDAIGGYPNGIVLEYWDGQYLRRVISLMDDNVYDFTENPGFIDNIHWAYCDAFDPNAMRIFLDLPSMTEDAESEQGDASRMLRSVAAGDPGPGYIVRYVTEYDCLVQVRCVCTIAAPNPTLSVPNAASASVKFIHGNTVVENRILSATGVQPGWGYQNPTKTVGTIGKYCERGTTIAVKFDAVPFGGASDIWYLNIFKLVPSRKRQ